MLMCSRELIARLSTRATLGFDEGGDERRRPTGFACVNRPWLWYPLRDPDLQNHLDTLQRLLCIAMQEAIAPNTPEPFR